jgi:hypothetical protein
MHAELPQFRANRQIFQRMNHFEETKHLSVELSVMSVQAKSSDLKLLQRLEPAKKRALSVNSLKFLAIAIGSSDYIDQ